MHYATGEDAIRRMNFMKEAKRKDDCADALAGIDDPEAFMAAVRELIFHYHAFGLMASPDFHKIFHEVAALLPPETAS